MHERDLAFHSFASRRDLLQSPCHVFATFETRGHTQTETLGSTVHCSGRECRSLMKCERNDGSKSANYRLITKGGGQWQMGNSVERLRFAKKLKSGSI